MRKEFKKKNKNKEKNINEQIFREQIFKYFLYQTPSYLTSVLYDSDEIKHYKITTNFNNRLIKLRNSINTKKKSWKWKSKKVVNIVEKFIDFNKKQKD